jgi:hypothetical protein
LEAFDDSTPDEATTEDVDEPEDPSEATQWAEEAEAEGDVAVLEDDDALDVNDDDDDDGADAA